MNFVQGTRGTVRTPRRIQGEAGVDSVPRKCPDPPATQPKEEDRLEMVGGHAENGTGNMPHRDSPIPIG